MAEFASIKLDHEKHLLLDQPLLRLPNELSRHNLKAAQIQLKQAQDKVTEVITAGAKSTAALATKAGEDAVDKAAQNATTSLDQAINRLQTLKRKLSALNASTQELNRQSEARVQHLEDLYAIPSLADVKYEEWSRVRLDRLLVDYLLRMGYTESAKGLAEEKKVKELVDCEAFDACGRIERSLRVEKRVEAALAWCSENKNTLKKMGNVNFEYELRLQQYIELARAGHRTGELKKFNDARIHAAKHLSSHPDSTWKTRAATLLAVPPRNPIGNPILEEDPYIQMYSTIRWNDLADLFKQTHHSMYQLPHAPLLHMALTAGLSALKTPACHSKFISPSAGLSSSASPSHNPRSRDILSPPLNDNFDAMDGLLDSTNMALTASVCPICSTELNKLAKNLPFAHHTKSHVENEPVVLPNGRVYGRERLEKLNEKLGTRGGLVRDPVELSRIYRWEECGKVYIL